MGVQTRKAPVIYNYSEGREKLDIKCTPCALALRDMCT